LQLVAACLLLHIFHARTAVGTTPVHFSHLTPVSRSLLFQKKRWTASQLLQHPWITLGDDKLANKDLTASITVMRKFNARRRLKSAADAVILANRMKNMMNSLGACACVFALLCYAGC
jgi:hypothetical protein